MATNTLIMGESGTGKSTSIRNLDPKETFVINVLDKPLPFKGFKKNYIKYEKGTGNYFASDDYNEILRVINVINRQRQDIKHVIIDDFQYVMANEYMRRARENGFGKFTEITQHAWNILLTCSDARDDLHFFILSHTEADQNGKYKAKTIGKMMDSTITMEGMFTLVLHSLIVDGQYKFLTQHDGMHIAKSPMGMFEDKIIDNDLLQVKNKINEYFACDTEGKINVEKPIIEKMTSQQKEEFDSGVSRALDSISVSETLSELENKFLSAVKLYRHDKESLSKLISEKESRKNYLLNGKAA